MSRLGKTETFLQRTHLGQTGVKREELAGKSEVIVKILAEPEK